MDKNYIISEIERYIFAPIFGTYLVDSRSLEKHIDGYKFSLLKVIKEYIKEIACLTEDDKIIEEWYNSKKDEIEYKCAELEKKADEEYEDYPEGGWL